MSAPSGVAKMVRMIAATASHPTAAVIMPRFRPMLSRRPIAASPASLIPAIAATKMIRPVTSPSESQPLTPASPAPNQSMNRKMKSAMPPRPATISPCLSLEKSN